MKKKSILKSKTLWFNLAMGVLSLTSIVNPALLVGFGITAVATQTSILGIASAVNIVLRAITKTEVELPKKKV